MPTNRGEQVSPVPKQTLRRGRPLPLCLCSLVLSETRAINRAARTSSATPPKKQSTSATTTRAERKHERAFFCVTSAKQAPERILSVRPARWPCPAATLGLSVCPPRVVARVHCRETRPPARSGRGADCLDPLCVISWGLGSDDMADYVCQRLASDQLRTIVDIAGSHVDPSDSRRKLLKRVRKRVPHLCLAAYHAVNSAVSGDPHSAPMGACTCSKCADPPDAVSASPPSAKKRRTDAPQETSPPPPPTDL